MDAGIESVPDESSGNKGTRQGGEDDQGMVNIRLEWFNQKLNLTKCPGLTSVRLIGIYDHTINHATISLVIEHDGTEYRVVRYHNIVNTTYEISIMRLKYLHRNMTKHFLTTFDKEPWSKVKAKFLEWNKNQLYAEVIQDL